MKDALLFLFYILALPVFSLFAAEQLIRGKSAAQQQIDFESNVPSWMREQILEDLAPFAESGVSTEDLDRLMQAQEKDGNNYFLARFKIQNGQITVSHLPTDHLGVLGRLAIVTEAFNELAESTPLPNVDFVVTMLDSLDGVHLSVPIFSFANDPTYSSNIVLMPDFEALTGYKELLQAVEKGNALYPWESKLNQAIWRGAMTGYPRKETLSRPEITRPRMGGVFSPENFLDFPRTMAVSLSLQFPHLINARYTVLSQCVKCQNLRSQYSPYFDSFMSVDQQLLYKYQLLLDGNTAAYSRAYWQLFSNSVMIKQDSDALQWYYRVLQPYVHYIPVKADLSDLVETVEWAINHDDLAKEISREAQDFAQKNLTQFHVMQYLYQLLTTYARLQK